MNAPPTYKHTRTEVKRKKWNKTKNSNTKLQDELNILSNPFGDYQNITPCNLKIKSRNEQKMKEIKVDLT